MRLKNGDVCLHWPLSRHLLTVGYYYSNGGKYDKLHRAIDLRCTYNGTTKEPVYAAEDGTVTEIQYWNGSITGMQSYGNEIKIKHADYHGRSLETRYAHLSTILVTKGQQVKEGQLIGYTGDTGRVNGAHLHFEVIYNSSRRNPLVWLNDDFEKADGWNPFTYRDGEGPVICQGAEYTVQIAGFTLDQAEKTVHEYINKGYKANII